MSRIAIKRLTSSDLGFFESVYRNNPTSHQKAINLNADVFVNQFYPSLAPSGSRVDQEIAVRLTVFGPDAADSERLRRAITRSAGSKNWRLNGEFVHNPEGQPSRFDGLGAGDLAILDFRGDPEPESVKLLLVAANAPQDAAVHQLLSPLVPPPGRSMVAITPAQLSTIVASVPQAHPIWQFAEDEATQADLRDAAVGGSVGQAALARRSAVISAERLAQVREAQEATGRIGEALAWARIEQGQRNGVFADIEWSSSMNAVSRYDFRVTETMLGESIRIDAKSTSGKWSEPVHMSLAEIHEAAQGGRYDLWRLFEVELGRARLKIARDIGGFAAKVRDALSLPEGVSVDNVSIDPALLEWQDEPDIELNDAPEAI